ncbi:MAG: molybdenum cofactor guanylyltransferase [Candidatus Sulfotelmatobacter sp.]
MYYRGMGDAYTGDVTAFILAGGKSTRMGADKAFVEWNGSTLLDRALKVARTVIPGASIVGSREKFAEFAPVVEDVFPDCGPLGGIHAALLASQTELNLILAIDMPFVSATFLDYLLNLARNAHDADVVVPQVGGRWQPLCAVYRRKFAVAAESALRAGRNRIDRLFDAVPLRVVDEKELEGAGFSLNIFRNLNTPEDLEAEKQRA